MSKDIHMNMIQETETESVSDSNCHNCQQPLSRHHPGCPASPESIDRQYRNRRRGNKNKQYVAITSYDPETMAVKTELRRKPMHRYGNCYHCRKPSNIRNADICNGRNTCRCAACEDLQRLNVETPVLRNGFKARPEQRRNR